MGNRINLFSTVMMVFRRYYPGVEAGEYTWNDAGLMTSDSANGISLIVYNHFGLPVKTVAGRGATTCRYTVDGALATRTSRISGSKASTTTTYSAGRMVTTDVLGNIESLYSYFPGGYFDKEGKVHYTFTDYQGSVIMVTDSDGNIEEQHGYYPYGEPWRTPEGQPLLYQGKERLATTGDHDFGARTLATPTLLWRQPDPMAHDYPGLSPYTFCAANPIRYSDPTGRDIICMNSFGGVVIRYITEEYDQIFVRDDNKDEWIKSQQYEYGTITEVGTDGQKLNENNYTLSSICIGYVWRCGSIYTNYTAANAKKSENSRNGDILYR